MKRLLFISTILLFFSSFSVNEKPLKIELLKYGGGGDWYANPTSLPNLAKYCNQNLGMNIEPDIPTVEVSRSPEII